MIACNSAPAEFSPHRNTRKSLTYMGDPLVPNALVQTVIGAAATAYSGYRTAHEFSEWFQEGARFVKRLRPTTGLTDPLNEDMPNAIGPSSQSTRTKRAPSRALNPRARKAVQACCEGLLEEKVNTYTQTYAVPSAASAGGRVNCINALTQGTGVGNRVGSEVKNRWLLIKGFVQAPPTITGDVYRFTVVVDHECYGGACSASQVFDTPSVYSLPNFQGAQPGGRKRFTWLADRTIPVNRTDTPGAGAAILVIPFEFRIPLKFATAYNGNAGTVGDIVKNSICVLEGTNSGLAGASWYSQVIYLDG